MINITGQKDNENCYYSDYNSLSELLISLDGENEKGITFVLGEQNAEFMSYNSLLKEALYALSFYQKKLIKPKDKSILYINNNKDFIINFWACILGGIIPIPLTFANNNDNKKKLLKVFNTLKDSYVLTDKKTFAGIKKFLDSEYKNLDFLNYQTNFEEKFIFLEELLDSRTSEYGTIYRTNINDMAYIQFSSGSTGDPRGVTLTNENLLINLETLKRIFALKNDDSYLSWMPLSHDMGLVGFHITSLAKRINQYILPTILFLKKPLLWFSKISEYKITLTMSPNFGYKYFLDNLNDEIKLDLSNLRIISNGAEPISVDLCNEFLNKMAKYNLRNSSMCTTYGIAEATLVITFPILEEAFKTYFLDRNSLNIGQRIKLIEKNDENCVKFVDVGYPIIGNCDLRICDNENLEVCENTIGNIQIKGKNVTKGYYNNPEASRKAFTKDGWLDTGDIGFKTKGSLVITGRSKDIIFVNGQNFYPHDIETVAQKVEGVEIGKIAACGLFNHKLNSEEILVFIIFKNKLENFIPIKNRVQAIVNQYMGISISHILPIKKIPKTTSGKIQRYKLIADYLNGQFDEIISKLNSLSQIANFNIKSLEKTDTEKKIMILFEQVLNISKIGVDENIFEKGINSIKAAILLSRIYKDFYAEIPMEEIFELTTIKKIANYIDTWEKNIYMDIEKVEDMPYYETSSAQKRIYSLSILNPENLNYNVPCFMKVYGDLNVGRLENTLSKIVERHEILKTSFDFIEGKLVQKINKTRKFRMEYYTTCESELEEMKLNFIRPFDLNSDLLFRAGLIEISDANKVNDAKYIFMCDIHHIIFDGTSLNIFLNELKALYIGQNLPELKIQYRDFASWQNRILNSNLIKSSQTYWLDTYKNEIPVLNLPLDYTRPNIQSFKGDKIIFEIDEELSGTLNKISIKSSVTLFQLLLAAYYILLYKYTDDTDIVVGTVTSGRSHTDLENIIGMFANTLALRMKIDEDKSVDDFLIDVKKIVTSTMKNEIFQFDDLVKALKLDRIFDRNPLFDTMFVLQNIELENILEMHLDGIKFLLDDTTFTSAKFDLLMQAYELKNKIVLRLEYCQNLFKKDTAQRFVTHYVNILKSISGNLKIKLSDISIITDSEKYIILNKFNNTRIDYPRNETICQLFEKQTRETPDSLALVYKNKFLTYKELDEQANFVAQTLIRKGVSKNKLVGVIFENSFEMIISILGILKAGGAYLPIDTKNPPQRIMIMVKDCNIDILLMQNNLSSKHIFSEYKKVLFENRKEIIYLEYTQNKRLEILIDKANLNPNQEQEILANTDDLSSNDLAYVIYTSGSTGMPKGVMVSNRNVVRLVKNTNYINFQEGEKILQTTPISFDVSTFEIWGTLLNGLTLYLTKEDDILNPIKMREHIKNYEIDIMWLISPFFNILASKDSSLFKPLKNLIVGGDVLSPLHINLVKKACPNLNIINGYGPTENTTFSCSYKIEKEHLFNIPIGKPISNSTAYIINKFNQLQPIGVYGELCVGGDGVAKGYINDYELTHKKFFQNPFVPSEMIYKTGDMARLLPDGNLEFLGRMDNQVKIRGYRVETSEIEYHILKFKDIKEVLVILLNSKSQLCAYYISDEIIENSEIKEYLAKLLPEYMIPTYYVKVEKFELTINHKVDRRKLPKPQLQKVPNSNDYIVPANDIYEKLMYIFTKKLKVMSISGSDSYFKLGGDSLGAVEIIFDLYKEFNLSVKYSDLIQNFTIEKLSKLLENSQKIVNKKITKCKANKNYYEASPMQKRLYFLHLLNENSLNYNMPGLFEVKGNLDIEKFENALNELIKRHEILRTTFAMVNGDLMQIIHDNFTYQIEFLELNKEIKSTKKINLKYFKNLVKPFKLAKLPLINIKIIKDFLLEKVYLLIDMHHIISDGISIKIILAELSKFYKGEVLKNEILSYKDFSEWYNQKLINKEFKSQEIYWIERLKNSTFELDMPLEYSRNRIQSFDGNLYIAKINKNLTNRIKNLSKTSDCTLHTTLLTAYYTLLYRYTANEDIIVGIPSLGRNSDTKDIVGMFINTLPTRNYPTGEKQFITLLNEVKENTARDFENQDYPFDQIVNNSEFKSDLSRNALFDTMFTFQNFDLKNFQIGTLELTRKDIDFQVSKFDITLNIYEENDELILETEYCPKLFKKNFIKTFIECYKNILADITQNVHLKLSEINILSTEQKEQILNKFNDTYVEYPKDKLIHQLFEEAVNKFSENSALVFNSEKISYGNLNAKANQLARFLRDLNVKPNDIIALMINKSFDMIITLLAILKAGGAYLPIDVELPKERVKNIIEDCSVKVLITNTNLEYLEELDVNLIDLNRIDVSHHNKNNLENVNTPDDLIYVIYTSGSSGYPKGVMIQHKSLCNFCRWSIKYYEINEFCQNTIYSSISFDAFVAEFFPYLIKGSTSHILNDEIRSDVKKLNNYYNLNNINISLLPTLVYEVFMNEENFSLKKLIVAGEKLKNFKKNNYQVYNNYGPTENTVGSTYYKVLKMEENIPIGKPIDNVGILILDKDDNIVPIGVHGQLCIFGDSLMKGYLTKQVTKNLFSKNPYQENTLLYKTGDMAKWSEDGNIRFIKRKDRQLKIRGYRIDLNEIEFYIKLYEKIKSAFVIPVYIKNTAMGLCAYYICEEYVDINNLKSYLVQKLPRYMIPNYFVKLGSYPLNINGKIDEKSLPNPISNKIDLVESDLLPNFMQEDMLKTWQNVLGKNISVNDDFFLSGGNSILAMKLVFELAQINIMITVQDLYNFPSIKELYLKIISGISPKTYLSKYNDDLKKNKF